MLMVLGLILGSTNVWAQMKVSGKVADPSGEGLPGVTVVVEGTTNGTTTDGSGGYTLSVPGSNSVLVFSFIGYMPRKVTVGNQTTLNVTIQPDVKALEEVVVVGYGTQDKRDVAGAIVSVGREVIQERQPTNVFDALQGQAAGVQVISESGRPGAGSSVRIRGTGTIEGGADPLYIVDNVPMENINGINPNDIQSMEILKDAASTAIYGSRSANGVILITTRKGVEGKPRVDLRYNTMIGTLAHKVPQSNAAERRLFDKMANRNQNDSLNPAYNSDNDYQALLSQMSKRHQADLSVSGGGKDLSYYTSLGFVNDEGIIKNSWAKNARARINIDYKFSDRFTYGNRLQFAYGKQNRVNEGNTINAGLQRPPSFAVYLPDGNFAGVLGGRRNPLAYALLNRNEYDTYETNFYNFFNFQFNKYLKLTADFNVRGEYEEHLTFRPALLEATNISAGGHETGFETYWIQQNYLNYDRTFATDHKVNLVLGVSAEKWASKNSVIEGTGHVTEAVTTTNALQFKPLSDIYNDESRHSMASVFTRANYSYKGRYILNATLRRDGSSRFGTQNKWGNFPSASIAWRFTDENFMSMTQSFLQDGKLRVSYGHTGNERIGNYDALTRYGFGSNYYNGISGVVPIGLYGNNRLSWETSEQFNAGIDLTALQNRISFTADFYIKTTRDLLYPSPLPTESGYDEVKVNVGSLQNRGLELMVNAFPVRKQDFTWNVTYNMGFNNDKVIELLGGVPILSSNRYLVEEGGRLGNFFGYQNLGIYQYDASNAYSANWERLTPVNVAADGKSAEYLLNGQPYDGKIQQLYTNGLLAKGGDVIWLNARQDSVIDDADRVNLGNAQPKFTAGFFNNVTYKNFSLSFNFYSSWGGKLYNRGRRNLNTFDGTNLTPEPYMIYNSWFRQGDVTDIPRISGTSAIGNMRELNSYFIEDASFIRLRNIRFTYTLNQNFASRLHLKGLSAYIYGNNLLTWTNYKWYDPEINFGNPLTMGEDNGRYPRSRQIGLGLNINL